MVEQSTPGAMSMVLSDPEPSTAFWISAFVVLATWATTSPLLFSIANVRSIMSATMR